MLCIRRRLPHSQHRPLQPSWMQATSRPLSHPSWQTASSSQSAWSWTMTQTMSWMLCQRCMTHPRQVPTVKRRRRSASSFSRNCGPVPDEPSDAACTAPFSPMQDMLTQNGMKAATWQQGRGYAAFQTGGARPDEPCPGCELHARINKAVANNMHRVHGQNLASLDANLECRL